MKKIERTFTIKEVYERMKYYVWCLELEKDIKSCTTHAAYQDYLKDAEYHCGDCTKIACSCARCHLNSIEITAQNIADSFFSDDNGWCGMECLTECEYQKGDERSVTTEKKDESD